MSNQCYLPLYHPELGPTAECYLAYKHRLYNKIHGLLLTGLHHLGVTGQLRSKTFTFS